MRRLIYSSVNYDLNNFTLLLYVRNISFILLLFWILCTLSYKAVYIFLN